MRPCASDEINRDAPARRMRSRSSMDAVTRPATVLQGAAKDPNSTPVATGQFPNSFLVRISCIQSPVSVGFRLFLLA